MADEIASGMGCPACWNNGSGVKSMLYARPGKFVYYCRTGHEYNDLGMLKALNPPSLPIPQRQTMQQGHETVQLSIPSDVKEALLKKYGTPERLSQTLGSLLRVLTENQCFIVNEEDIDRIEKELGQRPKTGQELFGLVYQKNQKIKELQSALGSPVATSQPVAAGVPEGKVLLDAQEFIDKARSIANFRNQPVEQVCQQTLKMAFDNGWA